MNQETAIVEAGPDVSAIAELPRDLAIVKMEGDQMAALAAAHPRDEAAIIEHLKEQVKRHKAFAASVIYSKPVGKDKKTGQQKFASGLSIRAAEAIREAYGFNRAEVDVQPVDDDHVRVTATFLDYQRGNIYRDSGVLSKLYKDRNGRTVRWGDERFYNVVVKAEASRRLREVILRSVSTAIKLEMEAAAEEAMADYLDDNAVGKLVAAFGSIKVTQSQLESHLGKRVEDFNQGDRVTLAGLWNAIEQGELSAHEVFGTAPDDAAGDKAKSQTDKLAGKLVTKTKGKQATLIPEEEKAS